MKRCLRCGIEKGLESYYKHNQMKDGRLNKCIDCTKKDVRSNKANYERTEKGVVRVIYKSQVRHSKLRNHPLPRYSKKELSVFLYMHGYSRMFKDWVESGYVSSLKPSIDRLDDFLPYSIGNIRLSTWGENRKHQFDDIKNGLGTSGKRCNGVTRTANGGNVYYHSYAYAERENGLGKGVISAAILRGTGSAGGYIWVKGGIPDDNQIESC